MQPPNIIYMHSHDTGRYVSPYGYKVRTPNLEVFAQQGVLFRQAFTTSPTCSPSRACLVTGQYAHNNGMLGLTKRGFQLNDYGHHVVHTLKSAGYHTALCGVQHVAWPEPSRIGYDEVLDVTRPNVTQVPDAAEHFLRHAPDKPFFLAVGFSETHRKFPAPEPADDPARTAPPAALPDAPEVRADMAGFNTMASRLDAGMGQILAALDDTGLSDHTLVIITTDHGIPFPRMKCNLTDHGTGVMLMMRGPSRGDSPATTFRGGKTIDALVTQLDLFPTLCDVAGVDKPDRLQGDSLLPLVRGDINQLHEQVFGEVNFHAAYEPKRTVRTERYRYIRRFDDRSTPVLANCDDGLSKRYLLEHGLAASCVVPEYLYDLAFDPNEAHNLVEAPAYRDVLDDMRARLDAWMRDTSDPLLDGPLMLHEGVVLNSPDQQDSRDQRETVTEPRRAP